MESFEQARKDALKGVQDAKAALDQSITIAAESLVAGVAVAHGVYQDANAAASQLLDQGKVGKFVPEDRQTFPNIMTLNGPETQAYVDTGLKQYKEIEDVAFTTATGKILPCAMQS